MMMTCGSEKKRREGFRRRKYEIAYRERDGEEDASQVRQNMAQSARGYTQDRKYEIHSDLVTRYMSYHRKYYIIGRRELGGVVSAAKQNKPARESCIRHDDRTTTSTAWSFIH